MPRRRLLATTLALMLSVSGLAGADDPPAIENQAGFLSGSTISCSTAWPSATFACWWERPVLVLGDVEVSIALDAQLVLNDTVKESYVAPMFSVAWYRQDASVWLEAALPNGWLPVPHVGRSDWLRLGATWRIP